MIQPYISTIPQELLPLIFRNLSVQDLKRASCVNRLFNKHTKELLKELRNLYAHYTAVLRSLPPSTNERCTVLWFEGRTIIAAQLPLTSKIKGLSFKTPTPTPIEFKDQATHAKIRLAFKPHGIQVLPETDNEAFVKKFGKMPPKRPPVPLDFIRFLHSYKSKKDL